MRANSGINILSISALCLILCVGAGLRAQTAPPPTQPPVAAPPAGVSTQDSANDLSVTVGKTVLVNTEWPIKRVSVGSSEVAEVHTTSPTEIMVNGKAAGETSLIVWDTHGGRQFFNVTVRVSALTLNDSLDAIRRELRAELPGQSLKVTTENGIVYLRGTVRNLESSARAVKIAATLGKVVNLLNVDVPASQPQILLKVRFASIDRNKQKQFGINIFSVGALNTPGVISTGQFSPPSIVSTAGSITSTAAGFVQTPASVTATMSNELNMMALPVGNLPFGVTIESLESKGIAEVLAEPNLVATNGKEASFLAGGEYPFPMVQGGGLGGSSVSIMFKEYGVRLTYRATITPRGTIHLQVAPEVSSLDFSNAIQISGFDVPAISSRKMKTDVELADGQTFVIGGLLDNRDTEVYQKIPFLGDIPIIGNFFKSMSKNRTNTELIVTVTPEIVAPISAGAPVPELKYPTKFLPPNSGIPMNTPDAKDASNTLPPTQPVMSVEGLTESLKEKPLVLDSSSVGFGQSGGGSDANASSAPASTPQ